MIRRDKFIQIDPWISVRRESHYLPFIAIGNKSEILCKLGIKQPERIWPRNCKHVIEMAVVAIPDRAGFPGAAPVHHHDRGLVQTRVGIRADGMCQMMIHETHLGARWPELILEAPEPAVLMSHGGVQP